MQKSRIRIRGPRGILIREMLIFMKLFCLFQFVFFISVQASVYSQEAVVNVEMENVSLKTIFTELGVQASCDFLYNNQMIQQKGVVSLKVQNKPLNEVLEGWLPSLGLTFSYDDNVVIIRAMKDDEKKLYVIEGKVVDDNNIPMPGVTVLLDSTQIGTATDTAGRFALPLPREKGRLVFSFVGFKTKKVDCIAGKQVIVKMEEDISGLDEVQVVAYGSQKKRTVISAISSVKGEELKELPTHSLENLLQGHMAGVEVSNISGSPGGGGSLIAIRGYNSLGVTGESSDRQYGTPLYVIDGVPMQAFTSSVTGANTLSDLDPSMIESIEVLKDAASAAIYGSRAGNGVILITTKKGRAGKAQFSASVSYSSSWLPKAPEQSGGRYERTFFLNALRNTVAPYRTKSGEWKIPVSYEEVYKNKGTNGPMYNWFWGKTGPQDAVVLQDSLNPFYNNSAHWYRQNYRTASVVSANLQASGGSESVRYMVGAGYYDEKGIAINTDFKRFSVLSNLTANPTKRLRMDTQLGLTYSDRSRGSAAGFAGSKFEGISADAKNTSTLLPGGGAIGDLIIDKYNEISEKNHSYSLRYNMALDYELMRNLHLKVSAGIDYNQQNQNTFKPRALDAYTHFSSSEGTITKDLSILNENLLTYAFNYLDKHNFNIMLGLSFQKDQSFSNKGKGINGPNDKIHYVGSGWGGANGLNNTGSAENPSYESAFEYSSGFSEERMNSYFGRLTYNYKEKYLFEATLRRDGSSVFGENVRWATFPSIAVGWTFSDEEFMKPFYWLSFGKIRATWGISGQKFSQRYLSQGLLNATSATFHGNAAMFPDIEGGVINKKLSWEETDQYDLGLDLSFWDYRLRLVVDYYYRYTEGQLNRIFLPGNIYYHRFQWQNGMAISNQGVEFELEADILRHTAVKWKIKFNASRNWNHFEKSADGFDFEEQVIGKPLHQIKVFKTDGFYDSLEDVPVYYLANREVQPLYSGSTTGIFLPGSRKIVDLNGDGEISENDDVYFAESPLPLAHGGFINQLRWKNFDLNIFFNYSLGRHIVKIYDDLSMTVNGTAKPLFVDINDVDIWTGAGSKADYPKSQMYVYLLNQTSGRYDCDIENVSFLRLKQLTLGYNVGERVLNKLKISSARLFITGENLFLLTNYSGLDPELVNPTQGRDNLGSYPLPRKFTVGLSVNF